MPPIQWHTLRLKKVHSETDHARRFFFTLEEETPFSFLPGQFLTCDLPLGDKRIQRWRSYTIANLDMHDGCIEFCVSFKENGLASNYFFNVLKVGDTIRIKNPEGTFILPQVQSGVLFLVCTGTGIAPFRAMLQELTLRGHNYERIHLIFGTRTSSDILYRNEFEVWHSQISNFNSYICLSRINGTVPDIPKHSIYQEGYVHQAYNQLLLESPPLKAKSMFLLCGWSAMIDEAVMHLLTRHQLKREQIKFELYG